MRLKVFLENNNLTVSSLVSDLCQQGVTFMQKSKDFNHNQDHVYRLLDNFDLMLKDSLEVKNKFNLEVVLLAICWHDTWKSKYPFNVNPIFFVLMQFYEGWASALLFVKAAKKSGLSKKTIKKVKYAIRKHNTVQIFPTKTIEAKILRDLDNLEEWSPTRLEAIAKSYRSKKRMSVLLYKLILFYYDLYMLPQKEEHYYFAWTKTEFQKRRLFFSKEIEKLKIEKSINLKT